MRQPFFKNQEGMVLVTALMFMVILFLLGTTAYLITSNDLKISGNYKTSKQAFYVAEAGIEHAISVLKNTADFTKVLRGNDLDPDTLDDNGILSFQTPGEPVSFAGGTYDVRVWDNADGDDEPYSDKDKKVFVTSIGTMDGSGATATIVAQFWGNHLPVEVPGAVAIYGDGPGLDMGAGPGGPAYISGFDHSVPDDFTCSGVNCDGDLLNEGDDGYHEPVPGLYVEVTSENMDPSSEYATEDDDTTAPPTSQNVFGEPEAVYNTEETDQLAEWLALASSYLDTENPNAIYLDGSTTIASNTVYGTREDPVVLVIDGDLTMHASGNIDGAGILIVNGDLTISGTLHWEGIILVTSDANLVVDTFGNFILLGALVVAPEAGNSAFVTLNGNTEIVYSSEAINNSEDSFNNSSVVSWEHQYN